ncbi:hypothetical protein QCD60_13030 [Pokkaliibacter sp. MBI-7]|uniref:hypothetical protein n=1 Tax=Pokkaliibacter sp. MBI-7 TaxID=3040600 RepID=UPI00244809E1|nr:hypothetical protein [Pokkaliibacter sp. MBI-7]MDH2433498.1 hypothetical protein [Pokkaliibacter sp. MBI-7]
MSRPTIKINSQENEFYILHIKNEDITISTIKLENLDKLNWFNENKRAIIDEIFPFMTTNKSIAESVANFYQYVEDHTDEEVDKVYEYRTTHGLRFAFRGQDVDDIYIGKISADVYEISKAGDKPWSLKIDINDIFRQLNSEIVRHGVCKYS